MATITLSYNARNTIATKTIKYVLSLGVFKTEGIQPTDSFNKSMKEMQSGKTYRLKNTENPIAEILQ
ncbi:MAG: hypothetical protein FWF53_08285 [Candidatus Azobacteroides sp.]|nr:hypothetical protein [Candidatus Azobacteroides sp.]